MKNLLTENTFKPESPLHLNIDITPLCVTTIQLHYISMDVTHGAGMHGTSVVGAASTDTKKTATMADISLYLTNVNVSIGQSMDMQQVGKQLSPL